MIYALADGYFVRSLREDDLAGPYSSWFEDQDVCKYNSHGKFPKTAAWFKAYYETLDREDHVIWAICHRTDGHIGNASLEFLSLINRSAEFAILIGDRRHHRRSVGLHVGRAMLRHAFLKLNLERTYCSTAATNEGMCRLALRLGMVEEGRRRRHLFLEGEWVDQVEFGILKDEFLERERNT